MKLGNNFTLADTEFLRNNLTFIKLLAVNVRCQSVNFRNNCPRKVQKFDFLITDPFDIYIG